MWVDDRTNVHFAGQIFAEKEPGGDVFEVQIDRAVTSVKATGASKLRGVP
jgi:hypothetical protein